MSFANDNISKDWETEICYTMKIILSLTIITKKPSIF